MANKTIELDCPPGYTRPTDLIGNVIEGTGLPFREPAEKFFGNFIWDYNDISNEVWLIANPIIACRINELYEKGIIRYGL